MSHVWKIVIRAELDQLDLAQGWAIAATREDALAMIDYPGAEAFLRDCRWPGAPGSKICWTKDPNAIKRLPGFS